MLLSRIHWRNGGHLFLDLKNKCSSGTRKKTHENIKVKTVKIRLNDLLWERGECGGDSRFKVVDYNLLVKIDRCFFFHNVLQVKCRHITLELC